MPGAPYCQTLAGSTKAKAMVYALKISISLQKKDLLLRQSKYVDLMPSVGWLTVCLLRVSRQLQPRSPM